MLPGGPAPTDQGPTPTDPSQLPPMPADPSQAPPEGAPDGNQPISPEQKQTLLDLISKIREKLGVFNALSFANKNKLESTRSAILKQVFEKLQLAGVDLTSRDSVAAFLAKLQSDNPELAAAFEKAMETLLGGKGMEGAPQDPTQSMDLGIPQQNNMNNQNPDEQTTQAPQDLPQG